MIYAEKLPDQCPPNEAADIAFDLLFRAIPTETAKSEHFLSKYALNEKCPPLTDLCRFASCSLMTTKTAAEKMLRYPNYKEGRVVALALPQGSGRSHKKKQHVDFWAYAGFDFMKSLREVPNE